MNFKVVDDAPDLFPANRIHVTFKSDALFVRNLKFRVDGIDLDRKKDGT